MTESGRDARAGHWMPSWPSATVAAFAAAVGMAFLCGWLQLQPNQRPYFGAYAHSSVYAALEVPWSGTYALPHQRPGRYDNARMRDYLTRWIFDGRSIRHLLIRPLVTGSVTLVFWLWWALPVDRQRLLERRQGRRLKGPEIVTPAQFSRIVRGDGIAFPQTRPTWMGERPAAPVVLPRDAENNHILLTGGTGAGKTVLIEEILAQIETRGETAVVYDPGGHFVKKFWRAERGDVHLNPLHAACPYWPIGAEVQNEAEALGVATALFPTRPHESNPFFTDSARAIFAHLLEHRPSVYELVGWLSNRKHLVKLLEAKPELLDNATLQDIMSEDAPAQKSGVMASLNLAAQSLKLCPRDTEHGVWSAHSWAQRRRGWVFVTNTSTTRARLVQLQSLWLDMIIMRLMEGNLGSHPVKLIVDELPTLNRLPAIPTALFEARKSNISVVLGFQGDKQLESRYGTEYETMIASCHTSITLKQNDGRAAKRASESIGEQEIDRLVESRQDGVFARKTTSFVLTRQREPLVMASQLSGLKNLRGFLKYGNLVTRLRFAYTPRPDRAVGIIPKPPALPRIVPDLTDDQGESHADPASEMPYVVTTPPEQAHAPLDNIHEV